MKTAAIYIRVSTDAQTEYSPDSQLKLCYKYAKDHNIDILPEHIYQEDGISGTKADKRPQFQKMISTAKSKPKPFDYILVYDFSRFARNKDESVMYKTLLRKKLDIDVISITQPLTKGKESIILESMYEAMDEYYSLNLSENTRRGKLEKATRGEHQGNPPYGYNYDKNTKQIIPNSKSTYVKFIFREWLKPESTITGIVHSLNSMNIPCTRSNIWTRRVVLCILQNPTYIGYSRYKDGGFKRNYNDPDIIYAKGKWQPIIDEDTWNKAKKKIELYNNKWFKYKKDYHKKEHWLRGIIKCSNCGCTLVHVGMKYSYFQCSGYTHGKCNVSHYISDNKIIPAILDTIKKVYTDRLNIYFSKDKVYNNSEIELLEESLKKLEIKKKRIKDAYINEIDTLEEYKENKSKLQKEEDNIKNRLNELNLEKQLENKKEDTYSLCKTAYEILKDEDVDFSIKDEIAHQLFEKIIFDKKNDTIEIYYK